MAFAFAVKQYKGRGGGPWTRGPLPPPPFHFLVCYNHRDDVKTCRHKRTSELPFPFFFFFFVVVVFFVFFFLFFLFLTLLDAY